MRFVIQRWTRLAFIYLFIRGAAMAAAGLGRGWRRRGARAVSRGWEPSEKGGQQPSSTSSARRPPKMTSRPPPPTRPHCPLDPSPSSQAFYPPACPAARDSPTSRQPPPSATPCGGARRPRAALRGPGPARTPTRPLRPRPSPWNNAPAAPPPAKR